MVAVSPNMTPPTLYVEERHNRVSSTVKSGAPMPNIFGGHCSQNSLYLSDLANKPIAVDYSKLPVLSLSLIHQESQPLFADSSFHLSEPTVDLLGASAELFSGSVVFAGQDYDLLCDMMDADALGETHYSLA